MFLKKIMGTCPPPIGFELFMLHISELKIYIISTPITEKSDTLL